MPTAKIPSSDRPRWQLALVATLVINCCGAAETVVGASAAPAPPPAWRPVDGLSEIQNVFPSSIEPGVVYAADGHGLFVSRDYGRSFAPCAGKGLAGPVTALLVDPRHPVRLYAGTAAHGVLISEDGGVDWRSCGPGLTPAKIDALRFSPVDRACATIYATHGLEQGGLSVSEDAGASWHTFAPDYAIAGLLVLDEAFFCAAANAAQGVGFYRHDASKGWYCVLPEAPRVVLDSPADPKRLWFSSRDAGISRSDNAGISTLHVGPPGVDVEAMAIDPTATGQETVYAFAPQTQGVIASTDGFATWTPITRGLEPSEWIQEGAKLAISCDGAALYACANGNLMRIQLPAQLPLEVHTQPAVAVAGDGPVTLLVSAPGATAVTAEGGSLGGESTIALHDDGADGDERAGDGVFTARCDTLDAKLAPGIKVVVISARYADGTTRSGKVALSVLPPASDECMWDAAREGPGAARLKKAWVGERFVDSSTGEMRMRLRTDGPGSVTMPFVTRNASDIKVKDHCLITFAIRTPGSSGPLAMSFCVHDNGQGSGVQNAQRSNVLDLARYLPVADGQLRTVSIPLGDLLEGSTCSPGLIDIELSADTPLKRTVEVTPFILLAQAGPSLTDAALVPLGKGKLRVLIAARGRNVRPVRATVRLGAQAMPMSLIGPAQLPDLATVPGAVDGLAGDVREQDAACYCATLDCASLGDGNHHIEIALEDAHGLALATLPFAQSGETPLAVPGVEAGASPARLKQVLATGPDYAMGDKARGLTGRLAWEPDGLDIDLAVRDGDPSTFTVPSNPSPTVLARGPHAELFIRDADEKRQQVIFVWTKDGPRAWCDNMAIDCHAERATGGYTVRMRAPIVLRAHALPGPGTIGRLVHVQWSLTTGDRHLLVWHGSGSTKPDNDCTALVEDPTGPIHFTPLDCDTHALRFAVDRPLADDALASDAWTIHGAHPAAVQLSSDHRRVWLLPASWPATLADLAAPGVHGADGQPVAVMAAAQTADAAPGKP